MKEFIPKLVDSNNYHLWTDVLHTRKLANQTKNKWNRGAYVRWTIIIGWTVLEIACQDALDEPNISYRFKDNLDDALRNKGLQLLDWSKGIWQKVSNLQNLRKDCVHRFATEGNLFPEAEVADNTVKIIREAVKAIYLHANKNIPKWIKDNDDYGWEKDGSRDFAEATLISAAKRDDPDNVKIVFVHDGKEHISEILSPGSDPEPAMKELLSKILIPISAIRAYQGSRLILERKLNMRGT
jgi:hypothetical protein